MVSIRAPPASPVTEFAAALVARGLVGTTPPPASNRTAAPRRLGYARALQVGHLPVHRDTSPTEVSSGGRELVIREGEGCVIVHTGLEAVKQLAEKLVEQVALSTDVPIA